ncbi:MAG: chemotaxis response regulator protein-glutamate methylesterase [Firmicutes bacterium]|jgi:two-component system chemotaxis response regulator CheB|nr:chemotaxis response regulator protein-glutamate methylesterase [Bacillota bacterium]
MEQRKVKVLIVDDSAYMRLFLGDIIAGSRGLELVATARDGEDALLKIKRYKPDVVTLDVEMPRLNGVETLKRIMQENPLPVIMVSSYTRKGSEITVEALALGAVDFVAKPSRFTDDFTREFKRELPLKITHAARAHLDHERPFTVPVEKSSPSLQRKDVTPLPSLSPLHTVRFVVAIGASTGGPRALEMVLKGLPADLPAAAFITQHMPPGFTRSLAERLDKVCPIKVKEAVHGEDIVESRVYLAPGGYHLLAEKKGIVSLSEAAPVNHVRPSVDVMMESLVEAYGSSVVGVILTGMGRDGSDGMAMIKEKGGRTIVQDPATAVIPGMPEAVIRRGLADKIVPLNQIAKTIDLFLRQE